MSLSLENPFRKQSSEVYKKKKAQKALELAKHQESQKLNSGKKWVILPDGKTKVLR